MTTRISINSLRLDGGCQPRAAIHPDTVTDYADAMTEGEQFPAVIVFYDGEQYWLADGYHRVAAAVKNGWHDIDAEVRQGTVRDAVLYSVGSNAAHGLRRTNADKRRAVDTLLRDAEWVKWSNSKIADKCGVSHTFVNDLRSLETASSERTYTTKHGTEATMNTTKIGQRITREPLADSGFCDDIDDTTRTAPERYVAVPRNPTRIPAPMTGTDESALRFAAWHTRIEGRMMEIRATGLTTEEAFALALAESYREGRFLVN